jgi:cytochrome c
MRGGALAAGAVLLLPLLVAAAPQGDSRRGEIAYQKCYSCHAIEPGRQLEGPSLHGIVGREVAGAAGFEYSSAMRAFATANPRWTKALLDRFIADPESLVPHTRMNFNGIGDRRERADLIAYLRRNGRR